MHLSFTCNLDERLVNDTLGLELSRENLKKLLCQNHRDRFASRERSGCQLNDFVYRGFRVSIFFSIQRQAPHSKTIPLRNCLIRLETLGRHRNGTDDPFDRFDVSISTSIFFFPSLSLSSFFFSREKKNSFTVERVPRITQLAANDGFIRLTGPWRGREIESAEA